MRGREYASIDRISVLRPSIAKEKKKGEKLKRREKH